jgi:hypothetical protein
MTVLRGHSAVEIRMASGIRAQCQSAEAQSALRNWIRKPPANSIQEKAMFSTENKGLEISIR